MANQAGNSGNGHARRITEIAVTIFVSTVLAFSSTYAVNCYKIDANKVAIEKNKDYFEVNKEKIEKTLGEMMVVVNQLDKRQAITDDRYGTILSKLDDLKKLFEKHLEQDRAFGMRP